MTRTQYVGVAPGQVYSWHDDENLYLVTEVKNGVVFGVYLGNQQLHTLPVIPIDDVDNMMHWRRFMWNRIA